MSTYLLKPGIRQVIAKAGETDVGVAYDGRAWKTAYAQGHPQLMVTSPDGVQTPVTVTETNGMIQGAVPAELLASAGLYVYRFVWTQGAVQVQSNRCEAIVMASESDTRRPCHQPVPDWAEQIFLKAETIEAGMADILAAKDDAEDAADTATQKASDAADSAEAAGDAQTAAEAAQDAAEEAAEIAATHNYGISVSSHTLVITPPTET